MELIIKQLKQNNQIFVPQTTAEAVLVTHSSQVRRLDEVLDAKIERIVAPISSGLVVTPSGPSTVIISHSTEIEANTETAPLLIKHDNRGHIVETAPVKKLIVAVNDTAHVEYDGSSEQVLQMGDDFTLDDNNKIKLNQNNL